MKIDECLLLNGKGLEVGNGRLAKVSSGAPRMLPSGVKSDVTVEMEWLGGLVATWVCAKAARRTLTFTLSESGSAK